MPLVMRAPLKATDIELELVSQFGGKSRANAVQGNYAYIGVGSHLEILDVTDPAAPVAVGQTEKFPDVDQIQAISVAGNFAYLAIAVPLPPFPSKTALIIVNVQDPANPLVVGRYETPVGGMADDLAVAGNYVYLVAGPELPEPPQIPGETSTLHIINVSDPANPTQAGVVDVAGWVEGVTVSGGLAYVVANPVDEGNGILDIFDVSDPANPAEAGSIEVEGESIDVAINETKAYVAGNTQFAPGNPGAEECSSSTYLTPPIPLHSANMTER